jgi:hypothetical protein
LTLLPTELVSIDTTNNQGELWFKAPFLDGSADTIFYIYYNNANGRPINAAHPLGRNNVWSNGYVAVYHMNNDPSTVVTNSVSNSLHGTASGSMTSSDKVAGQIGNGTDFDGSDDYISTADTSALSFTTLQTVCAWINMVDATPANQMTIIGKGDLASSLEINLSVETNGKIRYWNSSDGTTTQGLAYSSNTLGDNTWHQACSIYNGSNYTVYLDAVAGTANAASGSIYDSSEALNIGRYNASGWEFDGKIDQVTVSNVARTAAWIVTEYNNQNSPSTFYSVSSTVDGVPKPILTYPANRQDRFPLRANLFIEFNEDVQAGSGNITIKKTSNGGTFETIAIGSTTISGARVTIDPSSNLLSGTGYYVTIDNGAIQDLSSNDFPGLRNIDTWSFTTEGGNSTRNTPSSLFIFGE